MPMYVVNGSGGSGKSRWTHRLLDLDSVLVRNAPRQQRPRDKHQQKRKPKS